MPNTHRKFHNPARLLRLAKLVRLYVPVWLLLLGLGVLSLASQISLLLSLPGDWLMHPRNAFDLNMILDTLNKMNDFLLMIGFILLAYLLPKLIYALLKLYGELQEKNA